MHGRFLMSEAIIKITTQPFGIHFTFVAQGVYFFN